MAKNASNRCNKKSKKTSKKTIKEPWVNIEEYDVELEDTRGHFAEPRYTDLDDLITISSEEESLEKEENKKKRTRKMKRDRVGYLYSEIRYPDGEVQRMEYATSWSASSDYALIVISLVFLYFMYWVLGMLFSWMNRDYRNFN